LIRTLSNRWGASPSALRRHKEAHIAAALARGHEAQELARGDVLLDRVRSLGREALQILVQAKEDRDHRCALLAVEKAVRILAMEAKLRDELEKRTDQTPTANTVTVYTVWVHESGEELGLTQEPPFIADGDKERYIATLRRMRAFEEAKAAGRCIEFTGTSPTSHHQS
jgi:hypothetical protein